MLSLALLEPAWAGNWDLGAAERRLWEDPDFELEVFSERHHFDPPHRIEPERLASSVKALWERAEDRATKEEALS